MLKVNPRRGQTSNTTSTMGVILGKRKTRTSEEKPIISQEEAQAIFQRHFEAQFEPLPHLETSRPSESEEDADQQAAQSDGGCGSEWDGLSEESGGMHLNWVGERLEVFLICLRKRRRGRSRRPRQFQAPSATNDEQT
jgi:hypothetical protein